MPDKLLLNTCRLICSQTQEDDWAFYKELLTSSEVLYYVSDAKSEEEMRAAFESRLPFWSPESQHWLCLVVVERSTGKKVGFTGYIHRDNDCAEVGFLFAPEAQGKGYAQESLKAVCDYAFDEGGIRRLIATVTAGNTPSRRLLEKTGFILEEKLHKNYWLRNAWHNDWQFGLLRSDYFSRKS